MKHTLLGTVCLFASLLHAQSPQATVSGVVTDSQSASVPQVEIIAQNLATGQVYRTRSNETGFYSLQALPIGGYRIAAE